MLFSFQIFGLLDDIAGVGRYVLSGKMLVRQGFQPIRRDS